ncbi:sulfotransferase domain-containing protein [uncultured Roseobacter sp.]|uniref:sulfotransferase domain-containing protein n=1 Tax=uncultured Roseobacter sp. TaxID=114847 RepID=UPI002616226F|nr:sulfotransferase domain-containing protein [uncultured Roseobacter sp.]
MPDFCIIGAAKAGTTALSKILDRHPDLFMNPLKEPHYFSTAHIREYGEPWYRGLYSDALPGQLCGEASTSYSRYPLVAGTAECMAAANPAMKLIYILREPVSRVESECLQTMKYSRNVLGLECPEMNLDDFLKAVENPEDPRYSATISASKYIDQIEKFEEVFHTDQLLIVFQQDLKNDPEHFFRKISDFLEIKPFSSDTIAIRANQTSNFKSGLNRVERTNRFKRLPFYSVAKSILPETLKSLILEKGRDDGKDARFHLSQAMRSELSATFTESNRRLKARLGYLPDDWSV